MIITVCIFVILFAGVQFLRLTAKARERRSRHSTSSVMKTLSHLPLITCLGGMRLALHGHVCWLLYSRFLPPHTRVIGSIPVF